MRAPDCYAGPMDEIALIFTGLEVEQVQRAASCDEHVRQMPDSDTKEMLLKFLPHLEEAEVRQIGKIQRWQRGNLVGSGSYGKVYLAMNTDTAELFVVKQVPFTAIDKREEVLQLEQEIALLGQLEHANIVRYLGTELSALSSELSIFLEYMPGGSIADLVRAQKLPPTEHPPLTWTHRPPGPLSAHGRRPVHGGGALVQVRQFGMLEENVIRRFTREVLEGLDYLHGKVRLPAPAPARAPWHTRPRQPAGERSRHAGPVRAHLRALRVPSLGWQQVAPLQRSGADQRPIRADRRTAGAAAHGIAHQPRPNPRPVPAVSSRRTLIYSQAGSPGQQRERARLRARFVAPARGPALAARAPGPVVRETSAADTGSAAPGTAPQGGDGAEAGRRRRGGRAGRAGRAGRRGRAYRSAGTRVAPLPERRLTWGMRGWDADG